MFDAIFYRLLQLVGNAEIEESPVFFPSHPVEGMLSFQNVL